jgi:methyl-accepting chemotaxis protein
MASLVREVSTASSQQAQGIAQVSLAIAEMEKLTQSTAAIAEENSATSAELNGQAQLSLSQVRRLDSMVSRTTRTTSITPSVGRHDGEDDDLAPRVPAPPPIPFTRTGTSQW